MTVLYKFIMFIFHVCTLRVKRMYKIVVNKFLLVNVYIFIFRFDNL